MLLTALLFLQLTLYATCFHDQQAARALDDYEDYSSELVDRSQDQEERRNEQPELMKRHDDDYDDLDGQCPPGFKYRANAVNKCYSVEHRLLNWDDAQAKCKVLHSRAHLTIINSALENEIIGEILDEHDCQGTGGFNYFWTGGRRRHDSCSYPLVWKSNSRNTQAIGYTNYCPSEPDCASGQQHCGTFVKSCYSDGGTYGWQDDNCKSELCSVCEVMSIERS